MSVNKCKYKKKKLMRFFYLSIAWDYTKSEEQTTPKQYGNDVAASFGF